MLNQLQKTWNIEWRPLPNGMIMGRDNGETYVIAECLDMFICYIMDGERIVKKYTNSSLEQLITNVKNFHSPFSQDEITYYLTRNRCTNPDECQFHSVF
jgi:hypothetical protein